MSTEPSTVDRCPTCRNVAGAIVDCAHWFHEAAVRNEMARLTRERDEARAERDAMQRNWVDAQDAFEELIPVVEAARALLALKDGPRDTAYEINKPRTWDWLRESLAALLPDTPPAPLSRSQSDEQPAVVAQEANGSTGTTTGRADDTAPAGTEPHVFVQWKGTDACLDLHCACGEQGHYDGYFAYALRCAHCNRVWVVPHTLTLTPVEEADWEPLEQDTDLPHDPSREETGTGTGTGSDD